MSLFSLKSGYTIPQWLMLLIFILSLNQFATAATSPKGVTLFFYRNGDTKAVVRSSESIYGTKAAVLDTASLTDRLTPVIEQFLLGPTSEEKQTGIVSPIPADSKLTKIDLTNNVLSIYISKELIANNPSPDEVIQYLEIAISKIVMKNLVESEYPVAIKYFIEGTDGQYRPETDYTIPGKEKLPKLAPKYQPFAEFPSNVQALAPVVGRVPSTRPAGPLTGKRVGINAGHGWWYDPSAGGWSFQRGNISGYIEDVGNWQRCMLYVSRYLWNAGADVFPSREWDYNTTELVIDNDTGATVYSETGAWSVSSSSGYNGGTYRYAFTSMTDTTATATWKIIVPRADYYAVYQFSRPGTNRAKDARYTITHSGGVSPVVINQKMLGIPIGFSIGSTDGRWIYMGNYYFDIGTVSISVNNFTQDPTASVVIADAIRLGGGNAKLIPITLSGPTTTKPRWQASAQYWTEYIGAPASVCNWGSTSTDDGGNDWYCRPRHAIWEDCDAYIMMHTNAFDGTGSGTLTFIRPDNTSNFMYAFATVVNYQIKRDVRAYWDSTWTASTTSYINYAELSYLEDAGIPGALFEIAYHDNLTKDNVYLRNPKFEDILGRAVYKGVLRYFYTNPVISPLPPINLRVANVGDGTVRLSWAMQSDIIESTAVPTSYRIYKGTNGKGFDNGVFTSATTYVYSGLSANQVYYFQVAAVNAGGESMPTETLAVRVSASGTAPILIVYAYDRIDTAVGMDRTDATFPKLNQTFDYIIQHAKAIHDYGRNFDSADHKAVQDGSVNLNNYQAIIWVSGQQSTVDETFNSVEQTKVASFLNAGKNLFVSGSEIGWDLGRTSGSADSTFFANYLKASYVGDDAATYNINAGTNAFSGLAAFSFDNGSYGVYNVAYPDQIAPFSGAVTDLTYNGGSAGNAAVQYSGTFKVVYLAFPFEAITTDAARNNLMKKALDFFSLTNVRDWSLY